jgi:hypothetical protein
MTHQILGTSVLAPFRKNHEWRVALDEAAALGFNCVRTFCGPLPWCGQERSYLYGVLPHYLQDCADRGLNAYLSYCTEAGTGYSTAGHCSDVEAVARQFPNVVLREVGNEPWHPTQGGKLGVSQCEALGAILRGARAYGAAEDDESDAYAGGDFVAVHLSRARDKWNQVRRVRELLALSEATGKPCLNQEPIGADEQSIAGKRESDPAFYFTLGALNRLFLGGSGVFHSQSGLLAERLGPNQRRCAEAYLAGVHIWPGAHRLEYRNTRHTQDTAPFKDADLRDEEPTRNGQPNPFYNPDGTVIRLYAGIEADGRNGFGVGLGLIGSDADHKIEMQHGWRRERIGGMAGVDVYKVTR